MASKILVAYATKYGSTQEVAEKVAARLRTHGLEIDVQPMRQVRSVSEYHAFVLGAPLYIGHWHKDAQRFLLQHQADLTQHPVALFTLGPTNDVAEDWQGIRASLEQELALYPWLKPIASELFGGKFDPSALRFPENLLKLFPASPIKTMPASDVRDWPAIENWADQIAAQLQAIPAA